VAYNVGKACIQEVTAGTADTAYNQCFNNIQTKATNELRYQHLADAVEVDTVLAPKLYKLLNDATDMEVVKDCWAKCLRRALDGDGKLKKEADKYVSICTTLEDTDKCKKAESEFKIADGDCKTAGDTTESTLALTVYEETDDKKLNEFLKTGRATDMVYKTDIENYLFESN
jgi:hypothetical protein